MPLAKSWGSTLWAIGCHRLAKILKASSLVITMTVWWSWAFLDEGTQKCFLAEEDPCLLASSLGFWRYSMLLLLWHHSTTWREWDLILTWRASRMCWIEPLEASAETPLGSQLNLLIFLNSCCAGCTQVHTIGLEGFLNTQPGRSLPPYLEVAKKTEGSWWWHEVLGLRNPYTGQISWDNITLGR